MSEDRESSRNIKVVDRRRFTSAGEVRPDREQPPPAMPSKKPPESREPKSRKQEVVAEAARVEDQPPRSEAPTASSQTFLELVATLAQQAEMLIVGAPGLPAQPQQAQRLIDYLGVLEIKTQGNLSAEEKQIISNAVFQLRTLYVQHST